MITTSKDGFAFIDAEILNSLRLGLPDVDFKREALKKIDYGLVGWPSICGSARTEKRLALLCVRYSDFESSEMTSFSMNNENFQGFSERGGKPGPLL